jgi:hypothetical protein
VSGSLWEVSGKTRSLTPTARRIKKQGFQKSNSKPRVLPPTKKKKWNITSLKSRLREKSTGKNEGFLFTRRLRLRRQLFFR